MSCELSSPALANGLRERAAEYLNERRDIETMVREHLVVGAAFRQFRDAHAVNSHLAFNFDAAGTNYGRVALGLPSENLTL